MTGLQALVAKLPLTLILTLFLASLGLEFYTFKTDATSELGVKRAQWQANKASIEGLKAKAKIAHDFYNGLDVKVTEIRTLQGELENMKSSLSNELDIPGFVKMVVTEASKVGLRVLSIKPTALRTTDLYVEQAFEMSYQGLFAQLLVFLDRLAKLKRIVRVDSFDVKRLGSATSNYVEIGGVVQIKAYRYEDNTGKTLSAAPATGAAPAAGGTK